MKPRVILDPHSRILDMIFAEEDLERLHSFSASAAARAQSRPWPPLLSRHAAAAGVAQHDPMLSVESVGVRTP